MLGWGFIIWFLFQSGRRWFHILLGWGVGALCFLPYLPVLISGVRLASEKDNVTSVAASPAELISTFFTLLGNGSVVLTAIFGGVLIFAFWRKRWAVVIEFMLMSLVMMTLIYSAQ